MEFSDFSPATRAYYFGDASVNRSFGAQMRNAVTGLPRGTPVRFTSRDFPSYDVTPPIAPPFTP